MRGDTAVQIGALFIADDAADLRMTGEKFDASLQLTRINQFFVGILLYNIPPLSPLDANQLCRFRQTMRIFQNHSTILPGNLTGSIGAAAVNDQNFDLVSNRLHTDAAQRQFNRALGIVCGHNNTD